MRIISGIYRGRRLNPKRLKYTRPTTDFAREGLFNMLNSKLDFALLDVLDLYSGTGSIAIEFLSRGAKSATAVDLSRECVKFIAAVKDEWKIENLKIVKSDALKFVQGCPQSFDLIFADPPYDSEDAYKVLSDIQSGQLLSKDGTLIIEHDKHKDFTEQPGFQHVRAFGNVNFSFFQSS